MFSLTGCRSSEIKTLAQRLVMLTGFCLSASSAVAQPEALSRLASWVALDAPTGHEHLALDAIAEQFPGWERDRYGNLSRTVGSGSPHRVAVCAIDAYAYAISQIADAGYLRLHRLGSGSRHPLWDQMHEGQQLRISTRSGPVIGVTAIANGHFAAQHRDETAIVSADDLWLDVGAESAAEVAALGIALLDPVTRNLPAWYFGDEIGGPRSGARVGCAALMAAAQASINGAQGSTSYVMSVQQVFGWVGLGAALGNLPVADELIVLAPGAAVARDQVVSGLGGRVDDRLATRAHAIRLLAPAVSDPDALMERVGLSSATALLRSLVSAIDPARTGLPDWVAAPAPERELNNLAERWGSGPNIRRLQEIEAILDQLAEKSATPGHEGPIRNTIYEALPAWAQELAQADALGNLWVEFGPAGPATVFMAHMDEVGFEIAAIDANGIVALERKGGAVASAWESQPAVVTVDTGTNIDSLVNAPQLRGVFLTRGDAVDKNPDTVSAWFGMNSEQLAAAGVRVGMGVTGYKEGHRMGAYRYASRSLDDRVGSTALLTALQGLDPARVASRVIFAWSVREEGGLNGAAALAAVVGDRSRRIYSIDTFVTSDTPLESPHFAYAPLGQGPVLRSVENAAMAVPFELDRNRRIAADAGIAVQIGLTQGGTDGTTFTFYGAPNAGLSWPGRYSHSPAEIADLRDVAGLVDLIQAMALEPVDSQ